MSIPLPPLLPQYLGGVSSGIGGGGGGDEDPSRNRSLKSTHEVDPIPAISPDPGDDPEPRPIVKRQRRIPDGPLRCAVCRRTFKSAKALHGHMRCHPERNWRGVAPPGQESGSEKEAAASLVMLSEKGKGKAEEEEDEDEEVVVGIGGGDLFRCQWCKTGFRTRQALGGHRASHKSKKGCYMKGKEKEGVKGKNVMVAAEMAKVAAKRRRFEVDLNLPPPPEEEEEEEKEKKD